MAFDAANATPQQVADYLASLRAAAPIKPRKAKKKPVKKIKLAGKKRGKRTPVQSPDDQVVVTLLGRHNVNGILYGPGVVTAPRHLAESLAYQDQESRRYDETWQQERAFMIGPSQRPGTYSLKPVHPSFFQGDELRAPEAAEASAGMPTGVQLVHDGGVKRLEWVN